MVLVAFSCLGLKFLRISLALLAFCNALALYFIKTYHVFLTKSMMGNVLHTNFHETRDLLGLHLAFFMLLGLALGSLFFFYPIKNTTLKNKALIFLGSALLFFTWSFTHAKQWLFLDKHAKYIGGLTLPYSYSINLIRAAFNSFNASPPKLFSNAKAQSKNQVVVLVIGESARRANYSIYGYNRPTTPKLQARLNKHEILALKATSCATYTTAALECMLTSKKDYENLPSFLHRQGVSVVLLSLNNAEPFMRIDWHPREDKWQDWLLSLGVPPPFNFDEALARSLPFLLKRYKNNLLVILHLKGSHGPLYVDKIPHNFAPFKPICTHKEPHTCSLSSLINAYDNTIAYNDFVLDLLIQELKQSKRPALLLYMSDHGESLGEHGMYLHGTPFLIAPDFQKQIPFIIFTNGFKPPHLPSDQISYTQDMIFSSILSAFGMQKSNAYNPACDLFK